MLIGTKNPLTHIQSPLANAVTARATTNIGKIFETKTTSDSAATRSRNSQRTQRKKPSALGLKFDSQYVTIEKRREMRNRNGSPIVKFASMKAPGPTSPFARSW